MPPGRMAKLQTCSPGSQPAASVSLLVSEFLSTWPWLSIFNLNLSLPDLDGAAQGCGEIKAIMAFSFLLWILRNYFSSCVTQISADHNCYLVAAYTGTLLGMGIRAQVRGHSAWTTGVHDDTLFYPAEKASTGPAQMFSPPVTVPHSSPPAPPQSFPNTISYSSPGIAQV